MGHEGNPLTQGIQSGLQIGLQRRESNARVGIMNREIEMKEAQLKQQETDKKFQDGMSSIDTAIKIGMTPSAVRKMFVEKVVPLSGDIFKGVNFDDDDFVMSIGKQMTKLSEMEKKGEINRDQYTSSLRAIIADNPKSSTGIEGEIAELDKGILKEKIGGIDFNRLLSDDPNVTDQERVEAAGLLEEAGRSDLAKIMRDKAVPGKADTPKTFEAELVRRVDAGELTLEEAIKMKGDGKGGMTATQVESAAGAIFTNSRTIAKEGGIFSETTGVNIPKYQDLIRAQAEGAPQAVQDRVNAVADALSDPIVGLAFSHIEKINNSGLSKEEKKKRITEIKQILSKQKKNIEKLPPELALGVD